MPVDFTLPPDTRIVGSGNPPQDIDNIIDALTATGAGLNVLNAAFAGGADPTGVADSTAAIQAAVNAASAAGGGRVFIPPGTFLVSAAILLATGVELAGAGRFASTILANPAGSGYDFSPGTTNWAAIIAAVNPTGCGVRDLGVNANSTATSGIVFLGGTYVYIRDCYVQNATGHSGTHFFGTESATVNPVLYGVMSGNIVAGCVWNVVFDGQCAGCVMSGNASYNPVDSHFSLGGLSGLAGSPGQGNSVTGNAGYGGGSTATASSAGIFLENQLDVTCSGNSVTNFQGQALLYPKQSGGTVTDNRFEGNAGTPPTYAIHFNSGAGLIDIAGNTFTNAGTGILNTSGGSQYGRMRDNNFVNVTTLLSGSLPPGSEWSGNRQLTSSYAQVTPYALPLNGPSVFLCPPSAYAPATVVQLSTFSATMASLNAAATTVAAGSNGGTISGIAAWATPSAGVLAVANTAGWPTAGTVNVAASGPTTAVVTYTGVTANTLTGCAYVSGSPAGTVATGGAVTLTGAGTGAVAVPNISTGNFTAPVSGSVMVEATLIANIATASDKFAFGLAAHGTLTPMLASNVVFLDNAVGASRQYTMKFLVTGLTAASTYNFDLMVASPSSVQITMFALASTSTAPSTSTTGPVIMTVQAV